MSPISNQAKTSQRPRRKLALLSAVSLGLAAIPIGLAAPAQAAESIRACTVTAVQPSFAGHNAAGVKKVDYPVRIYCSKTRILNIIQTRWEDDSSWTPPGTETTTKEKRPGPTTELLPGRP